MRVVPNKKNSLISIRGELIGREGNGNLLLRNEAGIFPVKVRDSSVAEEGSQVHVVGTLHSFVYKRCRRHHLYIKAASLTPVVGEVDFVSLFLPLAVRP